MAKGPYASAPINDRNTSYLKLLRNPLRQNPFKYDNNGSWYFLVKNSKNIAIQKTCAFFGHIKRGSSAMPSNAFPLAFQKKAFKA